MIDLTLDRIEEILECVWTDLPTPEGLNDYFIEFKEDLWNYNHANFHSYPNYVDRLYYGSIQKLNDDAIIESVWDYFNEINDERGDRFDTLALIADNWFWHQIIQWYYHYSIGIDFKTDIFIQNFIKNTPIDYFLPLKPHFLSETRETLINTILS